MNKLYTLITSVIIGSTLAGLITQPAFAIAKNSNGITVSPAISNIQLQQGQNNTKITLSVGNVTNQKLAVTISTRDFGSLNSSGSIGFYGTNYKASNNQHGLSSTIQLPGNELFIPEHQSKNIVINLNNLSSLAPGGHYGAILLTPFVARNGPTSNQVNLQPSVASLVFLTTPSGGTKSINIQNVSTPSFGFKLPTTVYALINNTGNTQVTPRGVITLTNPSGGLVSQSVINSESGMVLPSTTRLYSISLTPSNNIFKASGIYQLKFKFRIDGSNSYQTVTRNFLYINPSVLLAIIILIGIGYLIRRQTKIRKSRPISSTSKKRFSKKS